MDNFLRLVIDTKAGRAYYLEAGPDGMKQIRFLPEEDVEDLGSMLEGSFTTFLPGDWSLKIGEVVELADKNGLHVGVAAVHDRCTAQLGSLFEQGYHKDHWSGDDEVELAQRLMHLFGTEVAAVHKIWTAVELVRLEVPVEAEAAEPEDAGAVLTDDLLWM